MMIKKALGAVLVVAIGLFPTSLALAYTGGAGITGTPHDMSSAGGYYYGGDTQQRICIYCHTPHNAYRLSPAQGGPAAGVGGGPQASDAFDYLPLWNHTLQADTAYSMYYAGPGAPAITLPNGQQTNGIQVPGSVSLLCLSCHDGSVAVNSYGNASQPASSQATGSTMIRPGYTIGAQKYLGNHHPIGFDYVTVAAVDTGLNAMTTAMYNGTIQSHLFSSGATGSTTVMECATCHSVHNKGNDPAGQMFLWKSDTQSQLCLTCHIK
jgi:Doubled CXXCH motif (Paired_CXXCH_1)